MDTVAEEDVLAKVTVACISVVNVCHNSLCLPLLTEFLTVIVLFCFSSEFLLMQITKVYTLIKCVSNVSREGNHKFM